MSEDRKATDDLLRAMEKFITTKSVVGEAITVGDTIILPMADVSFGMGVGTFSRHKCRWRSWWKDNTKCRIGYKRWLFKTY